MTNQEAIKTLRELWHETNDSWYKEVYEKAISALEKQIPKKPVMTQTSFYRTLWWLDCPSCGSYVGIWNSKLGRDDMYNNSNRKICSYCGQVIDWEEDE